MATCKDCFWVEVCGGFIPSDLDKDVFDLCAHGKSDEIQDIEERCECFKDKSWMVEVVRCKDCKNYGGVIFGYTCRLHSGPNTRIQMKESDFCSYGVRKDHG